jgi:hypothetical protein
LESGFTGTTAITKADMSSSLRPNLLILETYMKSTQQFIRSGVIGSVGVIATAGRADYLSQYNYTLQNGDGVMVFDGLAKVGY